MGKGNALPPAAVGSICDIDVGGVAPVAQRVRRVAPQFREKLSDLIKRLLSAKMITPSTSPWASPIVIIIKKNGVDIRPCIDYRLVNSLTRLMVYPMPMINELLEDLDKVLCRTQSRRYWEDIDDILVTATTWDSMCEKVERLLDACERWNLSISVVKSFWVHRKVGYQGHQREGDFHEIGRQEESNSSGRGTGGVVTSTEQADRWTRAKVAFKMLKVELVSTPILKHFDPDRTPVIILYASQWAIAAALVQEYDGVFWPVTFTSRTLKSNKLNYGIVVKEVLALLRMFDVNYTLLTTRPIVVLMRHSTLAWLVNSTGFQGRLGNWAALLSEWALEVRKCSKGEDEFLGVIEVSITPRAEVDEALTAIAPVKEPRQTIVLPPPTVEEDERLLVASFDGAARTKRSSGAYSAIIWRLPEWTIISAASGYSPDLTVNEAEYRGLLLGFDLLATMDRGRIVICGDSNLAIRQMRGDIACKAPGLQLLRRKALDQFSSWSNHDFLHMKCEWNQSADKLASEALLATGRGGSYL
ncbi:unnamed protein product [Phytophthora fragariaefolia]|uniref:Unnamed protein product n=1 Tax=Phytophthora fragariaefolia TaxID=1490495 RepID=A0A9W6UEU2_9STRA|nr:unnamed protein product [Phytophthora fragariaefolia]